MGYFLLLFKCWKNLIRGNQMNCVIRYTFEQVENILYKQAYKAKELCPNRYESDELVNEVWLKGNIQRLDNIKYVANRAYWDMIDYIRTTEGRNFMRNGLSLRRFKHITNMHYIKRKFDDEADFDFFNNIESKEQNDLKLVDDYDEIDHLLECLSEKKRTILKKYFLEGMTLIEIGDIFGIKGVTISNFKKQSIEKIREHNDIKVKNSKVQRFVNISMKQVLPLEEVLPEYVVDYEIDNKCSLETEDTNTLDMIKELL